MESGTCNSKSGERDFIQIPWLPQDRWGRTRLPAPSLVFSLNDLFPRLDPYRQPTTSATPPPCLLGIVALLSHGTVTCPTLNAASVATRTKTLNPFLWRASHARRDPEQSQSLGRRQGQGDGTAFDQDSNGSLFFLWVLQDTYEAETFFQ